jgi:ABC-type dipeptide/oligopeptide/nickel transport system ATPase component
MSDEISNELPEALNDAPAEAESGALLRVSDLQIELTRRRGSVVNAIRGVSFEIPRGSIFALVGVTGSGKSEIALSLTGLLPSYYAEVSAGEVWFDGDDLLTWSRRKLRKLRATRIAYLFREPDSLLNPIYTIGEHFAEALGRRGRKLTAEQQQQIVDQFYEVGLVEPEMILPRRPLDLKRAVRQRVMLALALLSGAELIIADEPTSELDAMAEMQFVELLRVLRHKRGLSVLLATHNFGIVDGLADEVAVVFSGGIVESGAVESVVRSPANLYTQQLIDCVPRLGQGRERLGELSRAGVRAAYEAVDAGEDGP